MKVFAVDAGFAQVKAWTGDKFVIFPTAVAKAAAGADQGVFGEGTKKYTIGDNTLVVGEDALIAEVNSDYNMEVADLMLNVPVFVAKAADLAGIDLATVEVLALGLQIPHFTQNRARLLEIMNKYTVNGITYTHDEVLIIPQAIGVLQTYLHETPFKKDNEEGMILDCGGNTLHVLGYRGAKARHEGTTTYEKKGIAAAAMKVRVMIQEEVGLQYSIPKTMEVMRTNKIVLFRGKEIDLSDKIDNILNDHFAELIRAVQTDFQMIFDTKNKLILAGGGAALLKKHLPDYWQDMSEVLYEPEFANVRGYYYYAKGV
jgi:hypothetical protein